MIPDYDVETSNKLYTLIYKAVTKYFEPFISIFITYSVLHREYQPLSLNKYSTDPIFVNYLVFCISLNCTV